MRKALLALTIGVLLLAVQVMPAHALLLVKCGKTLAVQGVAKVDPIAHHNEPVGTAHEHQFFGTATFLALPNPNTAGISDFLGEPTLCDAAGDTAAYWSPTLRNRKTGQLVGVQQFSAYYRAADGGNSGDALPIPAGARLISHVEWWTCGQFGGVDPQPTFADCRGQSGDPGHTLTGKVTFPSCWDGQLNNFKSNFVGDVEDTEHFAYPVRKQCPDDFPIGVTQLRETIQYQYTGDPDDLILSSDMENDTSDGLSYHADFINAWDQKAFAAAIKDCVNGNGTGPNCG